MKKFPFGDDILDFFKNLERRNILFNDSQKSAIEHIDGPLMVVAGPGSGKTRVITARTAYLSQASKAAPSSILVITFTRAAADEMKQRFKSLPGVTPNIAGEVDFGTFHSTFYKIVNSYYGRHLPVLGQDKARKAIRDILHSMNKPFDVDTIQTMLNNISLARTCSPTPEDFIPRSISRKEFLSLMNYYNEYKRSTRCIDFDDMMVMCKDILESDEKALKTVRDKYKYFLIDEFQDTNAMQFEIIRLLSSHTNNLCVVGDDDQSIYGFRGAFPECLLSFEQYYPSCKTVILDINYRSTGEIVDLSKRIISGNRDRKEKNLKSNREKGEKPSISYPDDETLEVSAIVDMMEQLHEKGQPYRNFAVLYRTNMQSRPIIDELVKRNIPFNIRDSIINFFDHWICGDMTSYLKLSLDGSDMTCLARIINRPVRYISRDFINKIYSEKDILSMPQLISNCELGDFQKDQLKKLIQNLHRLKGMHAKEAVDFIRKEIEYDRYIRTYCLDSNIAPEEFFSILDEYMSAASVFMTIPDFLSHINDVSVTLKNSTAVHEYRKDSINLSTMHGAKGLEFPCVFVIGVVEGLLPHAKCIQAGENIEEERRLFYVAVTRAMNRLFLTVPKRYHDKKVSISRFLNEALADIKQTPNHMNPILLHFETGQLVSHRLYGTGTIISINDGIAKVRFNKKIGCKKLDITSCIQNGFMDR
jgi:DNA helicase-2/ATP-dependent DNA helicase PcrA